MFSLFRLTRSATAATFFFFLVLVSATAASAQSDDVTPLSFAGPVSLARGSVSADSANSFYVSKADACTIAKAD